MSERDVSKQDPRGGYRKEEEGGGITVDVESAGEESEEEQRVGGRRTIDRNKTTKTD